MILPPFPPLIPNIFRYQRFSETQKGSLTKFFGTLRQEIFDGKSWYSPLLSINFFATGIFLTHSTEGFTRKFSALWYKKFSTENLDTPPPLIHKLFRYREFSETQQRRVQLWIFSALWDKKISTVNLDTPPPLLSINFFATGNFLKHSREGFSYGYFRHCETQNFWAANLDTPPPPLSLIHKLFRPRKFSESQPRTVRVRNFFGTARQQKVVT